MNRSTKILLSLMLLAAGLLVGLLFYPEQTPETTQTSVSNDTEKNTQTNDKLKNNTTSPQEADKTNTTTKQKQQDYHSEVSIPAFKNKKFEGKNLKLGQVLRETSEYTRYYITYNSEGLTISGIMNVPKGDGPFPVLILNHGYIDPDVYTVGRGLKREQDYFARNGYVVLHPDYRNHGDSSEVDDPGLNFDLDYSTDVINTIKAVQKSDLDFLGKKNIGMLGHSMGGGIALNIATAHPELIDALALYAPVSGYEWKNFRRWTIRDEGEKTAETSSEAQLVLDTYGTPTTSPEFWSNVSPINFVENIDDPIILHHGTADKSVPYSWSQNLNKALTEANKNITFHTYDGGKHEFITHWDQFMQRNLDFFDKHLKNL